jgi:hypothetical protein
MRTFEWAGSFRADRFIFAKKQVRCLKVVPKRGARLGWVVKAEPAKRSFEKEGTDLRQFYR